MNRAAEIIEYKMKYNKYFHEKVLPELSKYEFMRITYLIPVIFLSVITIVWQIKFLPYIKVNNFSPVYISPSLFLLIIYPFFKKNFENRIKPKIIHLLMDAFGSCTWTKTPLITEDEIRDSDLFALFHEKKDDDNFYGEYKGVKFTLNETELIRAQGKSRCVIFDGLLIELDMNKNFSSRTRIVNNTLIKSKDKVALEDPEFEKLYDVHSTDQIEARYIITPSFMERYKELAKVFKTKDIQCSFDNQKVLFAINTGKDMFSLGSLFKSIQDKQQYEELFNQITSIFSMIDLLKLNMKIGL